MTGVAIRPARESDMAYVYDTWLKALRPEYPDMRTGDYFAWMRGKIDKHMRMVRDSVSAGFQLAVVAHPESEPDVIRGFCVSAAPGGVLFVYVRPEHRKQGLGRWLLSEVGEAPSPEVLARNLTDDARAIKRKHPNLLRYIPC